MASLVTIFGGSGFLGRHTVAAFARAGFRVRVAVRRPNRAHFLLPAGEVGQIQVMKANVRDKAQVVHAVRRADAVVNLVGLARGRLRQGLRAINSTAPGAIAGAAMEAGARTFVHVSALGASLESGGDYAQSKLIGEIRARDAFPAATLLRPALVFGPEDLLFNRLAQIARLSPVVPLIGGNRKYQPVFVGDVARAVLKAVEEPERMRGRLYELVGPNVYGFAELLDLVLSETRRRRSRLTMPASLAMLAASAGGFVPRSPFRREFVNAFARDHVMTRGALSFDDLDLEPNSLEAILPTYLRRYRPKGQYEKEISEAAGLSNRV